MSVNFDCLCDKCGELGRVGHCPRTNKPLFTLERNDGGGVASKCGTANNRSDEIAFLDYILDNLACVNGCLEALLFVKVAVNERIAQLRAVR